MSDQNLVLLSQSGDNEAFAQLVRKYSPDAYRTAFMVLRDRNEVEDVVQESFLTCYRKIKSFRMESSFKTWLYRIVVNRCYDRLRKRNREIDALNKMSLNLRNVSDDINGIESRLDLREVIQGLRPEHRLVLTLYYGMDFGVQKVADMLGVPVGTVKSRLNSARNMIRKNLTANPL
ncbi:RNA polymerase sigma factor [Pelotomaculum propionicicum]|uniref:RNA polymerase sigma factor n=1 Tax=Pelotomaculum propionicicum TaxID=258475 RepID=UPI003B802414